MDLISRLIAVEDWQLTESFFAGLDGVWAPYSVDCMATFYNAKVGKFFSRFWNPGSAAVDFFVQSLESENCLVVPPVVLIARSSPTLPKSSKGFGNTGDPVLAIV